VRVHEEQVELRQQREQRQQQEILRQQGRWAPPPPPPPRASPPARGHPPPPPPPQPRPQQPPQLAQVQRHTRSSSQQAASASGSGPAAPAAAPGPRPAKARRLSTTRRQDLPRPARTPSPPASRQPAPQARPLVAASTRAVLDRRGAGRDLPSDLSPRQAYAALQNRFVFGDLHLRRLAEGVVAACRNRPNAPAPQQEDSGIRLLPERYREALLELLGPEEVQITINGVVSHEHGWLPAHPILQDGAPRRILLSLLGKFTEAMPEATDPRPAVSAFLSALTRQYDRFLNPPERDGRRRRAQHEGAGAED
jgi:hypothetical protein